jgi:hypothetical protein
MTLSDGCLYPVIVAAARDLDFGEPGWLTADV